MAACSAADSKIDVDTFCKAFPFHIMINRELQILQLGSTFMRHIMPEVKNKGLKFSNYFELLQPRIELTFENLVANVNTRVVIKASILSKGNGTVNDVCILDTWNVLYFVV